MSLNYLVYPMHCQENHHVAKLEVYFNTLHTDADMAKLKRKISLFS